MPDVNIVGSGPNGLAAAVVFARAGLSVHVSERAGLAGGGLRTAELTLPGYRHDLCSAVHPAALASPFFRAWGLTERVDFIVPEVSYAHPLTAGHAAIAYRDLDRTVAALGVDGPAWRRLIEPLLDRLAGVVAFTGSQLLQWPDAPLAALEYGLRTLEQGSALWRVRFQRADAPALFAGVAAHAGGPQPSLGTAGAGLLLAVHGHAAGWGYPRGGSQLIADALVADIVAHGGEIELGHEIRSPADLEPSRVTMLDTSPDFLASFAGAALPGRYRGALRRYRYGSGVAKVDFALSAPVPWANAEVALAPTVHLGGDRVELTTATREVARGEHAQHPFVLVTQPSIFDESRAPAGHQVLWTYAYVPAYSDVDMTETIIRRIERFAPGFRDTIVGSSARSARAMAEHDPNFVGGDILGGAVTLRQLLKRPVVSPKPWKTPAPGVYLCSASTPPGPAVHGMNGWFAAVTALHDEFGIARPPSLAP